MLRRFDVELNSNPVCSKPIQDFESTDFQYYDKDGFELNQAEQKYYRTMDRPLHSILNHCCWQEPWFELEKKNQGLILDHCMILHRCSYTEKAESQLREIKKTVPEAEWLLKTPQKWGFDFALDAVDQNGEIYEVLHIEFDSYNYDYFIKRMLNFEFTARHTDWRDAAHKIQLHKDKWKNLKGFAQNDWKAEFLIGWKKSEYTEKSLTF